MSSKDSFKPFLSEFGLEVPPFHVVETALKCRIDGSEDGEMRVRGEIWKWKAVKGRGGRKAGR
jgi:hypothetical protein